MLVCALSIDVFSRSLRLAVSDPTTVLHRVLRTSLVCTVSSLHPPPYPIMKACLSLARTTGVRHAIRSSSFPISTSSVRHGSSFATFNWKDPLNLEKQLTDEERMVRDTAHTYAQEKLLPRITQANRSGKNKGRERELCEKK